MTRGFDEAGQPLQAFWGAPAIVADERAPLVVVYLVDTLRADHTGPYGYARDTTPELDRFARDGVVFDQAIASASWTKPSVASLFTSLAPRPAPRGAAPRPPRRLGPDPGRDAAGQGLRHRRGHRQLGDLPAGGELPAGLRLLRGPARRGGAALEDRGSGAPGGPGPRLARRPARPADLPLRPHHGPARALHAARALRPQVRAPPDARATRARTRAPTTRSPPTASA